VIKYIDKYTYICIYLVYLCSNQTTLSSRMLGYHIIVIRTLNCVLPLKALKQRPTLLLQFALSVFYCVWSSFTSRYIFPSQLSIPLRSDNTVEQSAEDCLCVCQHILLRVLAIQQKSTRAPVSSKNISKCIIYDSTYLYLLFLVPLF
jgi:hypothetical protein